MRKGLSLRYKILLALTVLPLVGISCFLSLAIKIFEKDKIAYIFDSNLNMAKNKAARASSEISSYLNLTQSVILGYSANTKTLAESSVYQFNNQDRFLSFSLYVRGSDGQYERVVQLQKEEGKTLLDAENGVATTWLQSVQDKVLFVKRVKSDPSKLFLVARFGEIDDPNHQIVTAIFNSYEFSEMFQSQAHQSTFLLKESGEEVFGANVVGQEGWRAPEIWAEFSNTTFPEGIGEVTAPSAEPYLVSYVRVGLGDMVVLSMVDKKAALSAIDVLLKKSLLYFLAVLSFTTIVSVFAAQGMTAKLRDLLFVTQKVSEGDFTVRVNEKGGDEIGSLAQSFNTMAEEVSRLMAATADKARMEAELATAKTVQETLFPEQRAELNEVKIAGFYQPASECGGDWWYYCVNNNKVYLWIGDVTGHGAPAALLTSAARAVASVIQGGPDIGPAAAMGILNRAICDTSKGKMMMTFFLASIDRETGEMTYCNASHEAPFLLKKTDDVPGRDDYLHLIEENNPRLGEQPDCQFKQASTKLDPGDRVVFYTDGVMDVKSPEQKAWGERKFIKTLSANLFEHASPDQALQGLVNTLQEFRQDTPLDDDVTLIVCSYKGAA